MLEYPETLAPDQLLEAVLRQLGGGTATGRAVYYWLLPWARAQNRLLLIADEARVVRYLLSRRQEMLPVTREERAIDWPAILHSAELTAPEQARNNPFGMDDKSWWWARDTLLSRRNTVTDSQFLHRMSGSEAWTDLDLLLRELRAFGAQPLVLCMPLLGRFSNYQGVSPAARRVLYERMRRVADSYSITLLNFAERDEDVYFLRDHAGHLSAKGWLYYDEALDRFYHANLR